MKTFLVMIAILFTGGSSLLGQTLTVKATKYSGSAGIFYEVDGIISFEAEHYREGRGWKEVDGTSGTAMRDAGGTMSYELHVAQKGRYYVYTLARRTDAQHPDKANDVFAMLNGIKLFGSDDNSRPDGLRCTKPQFTWESKPKGPGGHTPRTIISRPVYFAVEKPGAQTFTLRSRSPGYEVDKFVFVHGTPVKPQGNGPAETVTRSSTGLYPGSRARILFAHNRIGRTREYYSVLGTAISYGRRMGPAVRCVVVASQQDYHTVRLVPSMR